MGQKSPKSYPKRQIGKKLPKRQKNAKVAKSPQIRLQGVSRGFRWFQTARTTQGTYARAPYAFAALVQGLKGPELVTLYGKSVFN